MASQDPFLVRFAREYGWRAYAIPVLIIITVLVLWDVVAQPATEDTAATSHPEATVAPLDAGTGPDPAQSEAFLTDITQLPPGGPFTQTGKKTYREVGLPGLDVGQGTEKTIRFTVEVEDGVDTSSMGGDDALSQMIDATLADPKGWTADSRFKFIHVRSSDNPDFRFQLTSLDTTHELCGNDLRLETSCFTSAGDRIVINHARWIRGAVPFQGDVGSYRQYLINHEFGHGLGYARHEPCSKEGALAPVMMQQTLSLNNSQLYGLDKNEVYPDNNLTCVANSWPYPSGQKS